MDDRPRAGGLRSCGVLLALALALSLTPSAHASHEPPSPRGWHWMRGTYTLAQDYDLRILGTFLKIGGPGRDRLVGTAHDDTIRAGPGRDLILGLGGADRLEPGPGRDRVLCGAGHDRVRADRGDRLVGWEYVRWLKRARGPADGSVREPRTSPAQ